jgi:hypothetical protein
MELQDYPKPYIHDTTLALLLGGSEDRRYSWVKRALKKGQLVQLKRGVYLIEKRPHWVDVFELAQQLYGPSYVSLESALEYHGWICEAVYLVTSVCTKRGQEIRSAIGGFHYDHTPPSHFFMGVTREVVGDQIRLIADPWKAIADYIYVYHKRWATMGEMVQELRLDLKEIVASDISLLKEIGQCYGSLRVRQFANLLWEELKRWI